MKCGVPTTKRTHYGTALCPNCETLVRVTSSPPIEPTETAEQTLKRQARHVRVSIEEGQKVFAELQAGRLRR